MKLSEQHVLFSFGSAASIYFQHTHAWALGNHTPMKTAASTRFSILSEILQIVIQLSYLHTHADQRRRNCHLHSSSYTYRFASATLSSIAHCSLGLTYIHVCESSNFELVQAATQVTCIALGVWALSTCWYSYCICESTKYPWCVQLSV